MNTGRTHFKKGSIPWNKGKKMSTKYCKIMSKAQKGRKNTEEMKNKLKKVTGYKRYNYKDYKAGYNTFQIWARRHNGKAVKCENGDCIYPRLDKRGKMMEKPKRYHWININKKYKRTLSGFIQLCPSCNSLWKRGSIEIFISKK